MRVLIVDNYDSYTFNLYQLISSTLIALGREDEVDVLRPESVNPGIERKYERIVISPGPGSPLDESFRASLRIIKNKTPIPVLGVCLGMQGIAHAFGGEVLQAKLPMHGKTSVIIHNQKGVFANVPQPLSVMRYHSLIANKNNLPPCLEITALTQVSEKISFSDALQDDASEIMGLRHRDLPLEGVQFHPESFKSDYGAKIIKTFLLGSQPSVISKAAIL